MNDAQSLKRKLILQIVVVSVLLGGFIALIIMIS